MSTGEDVVYQKGIYRIIRLEDGMFRVMNHDVGIERYFFLDIAIWRIDNLLAKTDHNRPRQ